ncbi:hypothetical protein Taro_009796 [Colocasia esculenta]|uniref:RNase H type-1 domain-containing protein n=1 Tax=Colocasia esculenta TaxID=4460 RepID=A0A843U5V2_COLES|nr:hypothetical protein [Colocasia esculenta]
MQVALQHCPRHLFSQYLTNNDTRDTWIWCSTSSGIFSTKSVRLLLQTETTQNWKALWSPYIPLKWSIHLWRMVQNLIPVDVTIQAKGVSLCSMCSCCLNHEEESLQHLFFYSDIANKVWTDLSVFLQFNNNGITNISRSVYSFLTRPEITTSAGRLQRCIFMAVIWEIWCSRNRARFQGKGMSAQHIINRSWLSVQAIWISANFQRIPQIWSEALRQPSKDEVNRDTMAPKVAKWFTPPKGRLKLNVDGAFKMTTNEAGGGGILRDHKGNMSCAFAKPYYHLKSSLAAEAFALRDGLLMCCNKGVTEVQVETDSLNLLQIVTG